jgi:hypothetical protein
MANTDARMEYVGNAAPTVLEGDLSDSGTSFNLGDGTNYPTGTIGDFTLVVNKGGVTEEKILCGTRTGTQVTIAPNGRGYDGTLPQTHSSGESVQVCWPAVAADKDNLHNSSTSGVHGVAGNVVGDSDAQTLTHKTIDAAQNTILNLSTTALLATARHQYGVGAPTVTGTLAAIDATNLSVSFTVPSSGKVLLRAIILCGGNTGGQFFPWWIVHGTTSKVGATGAQAGAGTSATNIWVPSSEIVTGLTPGAALRYDIAATVAGGSGTTSVYDVTLEVWAA